MKRTKKLVLTAALVMTMGMAACTSKSNQPAPVANIETMTVNSTEIEITSVPYEQHQKNMLQGCDYYTDAYEEPDSPEFVFIAPAGKSVYRNVTDVTVDASQNVTITVCETNADMIASTNYPITQVKIYPFPASVTVIDEDGNTLNGQ